MTDVADRTATMRALVLDGPGDPAELRARRVARPEPAPDEVLVSVAAAAVNRSDVLNVRGVPITTYPRVPGRDFAGTVVEGPEDLVGQEVWGTGSGDLGFSRDGSHAELLVLPAAGVVPRPATWGASEAAAAGLAYVAAQDGLDRAGLHQGQTVLVTGAAGGVGGAACAIARWRGARVIAAVLDEAEAQRVAATHADTPTIQTADGGLAEAVLAATGGRGADLVYDTVGAPLFADGIASLAPGGAMAVITAPPDMTVELDLFGFYRRAATLVGVNTTLLDCGWCAAILGGLMPGFEDGSLPAPAIAATVPFDDCATAYRRVEAGAAGRVVLTLES